MENKPVIGAPTPYKKTRIAPTPSGFLHLGNVFSFAITTALARRTGANILLRIDDLDRARVNNLYLQDIFDTLNFLEIPWDEGPGNVKDFEDNYSQLGRLNIYNEALIQLADEQYIFACTCSRRQLHVAGSYDPAPCTCQSMNISLATENASWRLITDKNDSIALKNYDGKITNNTLPDEMKNFLVRKKDSFPAYQLTSVIDDLFYGVDLVVRGEDLWASTLAQHQLSELLNKKDFNDITFYHHRLLTDISGQKLSKSAGATSVKYFREHGLKPVQVYNLIGSMLGANENIGNWQELADASIFH